MSLWETFSNTFLDRFFPQELREVKEEDFINLKLKKMSIKEFALKFHQLSRYALEIVAYMRYRIKKFAS